MIQDFITDHMLRFISLALLVGTSSALRLPTVCIYRATAHTSACMSCRSVPFSILPCCSAHRRLCGLLGACAFAFNNSCVPTRSQVQQTKQAAVAAALSSCLLSPLPANADLGSAAIEFTDAAYPIIGSLKAKQVAPLTGKAIGVALTASPQEIIKTVDAGLDAFLSVPPEKFISTVKALKAATAQATSASSCNLICMPPLDLSEKVGASAADALASADKAKVKAFADQAIKTLNSADKLALVPLLADGAKFAGTLNPGDVAKATAAGLEVVKASGAIP